MKNLVAVTEKEFDVELDIKYASGNNVTKEKIYNEPLCYLHEKSIYPLRKAIQLAKMQGFRLKIFDGYRPIKFQEFLFNKFPGGEFVSDPKTGSAPHCRGVAIDLTLIDRNSQELEMGTEFDNFTTLAYHGSDEISKEAQKNRYILMGIMLSSGWDFYQKEWWHYQLFNPREYPVIEDFEI